MRNCCIRKIKFANESGTQGRSVPEAPNISKEISRIGYRTRKEKAAKAK